MALPLKVIVAKAALALVTDKRSWRAVGVIIAAIATPIIVIVVSVLGMGSATAHHNNAALNLAFNSGTIPASMPAEYHIYITEMRDCFRALDNAVAAISRECEWEDGELDMIRVKSVFYALYFGDDNLRLRASQARAFVDCFVRYETRTRPCTKSNCHDEDENCIETYKVAIPIDDLPTVYANVSAYIGRALTPEDMANISEIYLRVSRGDFSVGFGSVSLSGGENGTHDLIADLIAGDENAAPAGGYGSPVPGNWRDIVSCEFAGYVGHTGIDFKVPVGTEIRAIADGTVLFTRASTTGYGLHVVINHGGGIVTLYAHCSRILVGEGQRVSKGQVIALSGNTGNSTGPHLHFEYIISGKPVNPRPYLP